MLQLGFVFLCIPQKTSDGADFVQSRMKRLEKFSTVHDFPSIGSSYSLSHYFGLSLFTTSVNSCFTSHFGSFE